MNRLVLALLFVKFHRSLLVQKFKEILHELKHVKLGDASEFLVSQGHLVFEFPRVNDHCWLAVSGQKCKQIFECRQERLPLLIDFLLHAGQTVLEEFQM